MPQKHYKLIRFYSRAYQPKFNSKLDAERHVEAHALTSKATCYTELWEMSNEQDGEMVAVFDYGTIPARKLT